MRFSQGWNVLWNSDGDKCPSVRLWINSPPLFPGETSPRIAIWCWTAFATDRCIWTNSDTSSLAHCPPGPAWESIPVCSHPLLLTLTICHCRATAPHWLSWWAQPGDWWLAPGESPLHHFFTPHTPRHCLFVETNVAAPLQPTSRGALFRRVSAWRARGQKERRGAWVTEQNPEPFLTIITKHLHRKTRTLAISIGEKGPLTEGSRVNKKTF